MPNWIVIDSYNDKFVENTTNKGITVHLLEGNYKSPNAINSSSNYLIESIPPYTFENLDEEDPLFWEHIREFTQSCFQRLSYVLPGEWRVIDLTKNWVCGFCYTTYKNTVKKYKVYGSNKCERCLREEFVAKFRSITNIYFIKESFKHCIKIGQSYNVEKRLKEIQTGTPAELTVEFEIPTFDGNLGEDFFQKLFSKKHIRGEWYEIEENELEFLKKFNKNLLSRGYSLLEIIYVSKVRHHQFHSIKELAEYVENWIEKHPQATSPNEFFKIYYENI